MKSTLRIHAALLTALLIIGGTNMGYAGDAPKNQTCLKTNLAGGPIQGQTPLGSAAFCTSTRGTRLTVAVDNVNLPAGTTLDVTVIQGTVQTTVGAITLSASGAGDLELNSRDGDTAPAITKGDLITVVNGNTTILAGVF
jgi:hypothetical protein